MQVAIVTGASSGIGRSAAIQIAKRGTGVILTYQGNESGALDTVATIDKEGGTAVALPLDVGADPLHGKGIQRTWHPGQLGVTRFYPYPHR